MSITRKKKTEKIVEWAHLHYHAISKRKNTEKIYNNLPVTNQIKIYKSILTNMYMNLFSQSGAFYLDVLQI